METTFAADGVVLKPVEEAQQAWLGDVLPTIPQDGFRLASVAQPSSGGWTCDGWGAASLIPGESGDRLSTTDLLAVLAAGRAFHAATQHLPRPSASVDSRTDPWAYADAAAWGERQLDVVSPL